MLRFLKSYKKQKVHFLHIGKTGGSAIRTVLKDQLVTKDYRLTLHNHDASLKDIPLDEQVVFFLRDPISRFISGFYSRQRKGQPRYYSEWSAMEKEVFEHFKTPNEIAVALADTGSADYSRAVKAMKSVQHFQPYSDWYIDHAYFLSRADKVLYVGFQETLDNDFEQLKVILGLQQSLALPTGDIEAHKNPADVDKSIEEAGKLALRKWYAPDYEFIATCKALMAAQKI